MQYCVREFTEADTEAANAVALAAFAQYRGAYTDWPTFSNNISSMASLGQDGEIILFATLLCLSPHFFVDECMTVA